MRVYGNAALLLATQVVAKVLGALLTIVAARKLGVQDYGLYAFALSLGYILSLVVDFGFPQLITREIARHAERTAEILGHVFVLEAVFTVMALVALVGILAGLGYPVERARIASIAAATMLLNGMLNVVVAFFRAYQRMELEAAARLCLSFVNVGLSLGVLFAGYGVLELAIVQLAAFVLAVAFAVVLVARVLARPSFMIRRATLLGLLTAALPLALSNVFVFVYDGTGVLILSLLRGDTATGLYAGAMNFIRVFGILPASIVAALLPAMGQAWRTSHEAWNLLYVRSLKWLLLVALPFAVGLFLLSHEAVVLVLGTEYVAAAPILQWAAWLIMIVFVNHGLTNALLSMDRERAFLGIVSVAMAFNVAANFFLVHVWEARGVVVASLLTEGLVFVLQWRVLRPVLRDAGVQGVLPRLAVKPLLSAGLLALATSLAQRAGIAAAIVAGAITYVAALLAWRVLDADELVMLRTAGMTLKTRLTRRRSDAAEPPEGRRRMNGVGRHGDRS